MTNATLAFQPQAERYYAQGYWRDGDLWGDFDARAREHGDRIALVLEERAVTYTQLRRAAVAVSHRLPRPGLPPARGGGRRGGDVVNPVGPPLDRGRGRDARRLAPGGRAPAAPAD